MAKKSASASASAAPVVTVEAPAPASPVATLVASFVPAAPKPASVTSSRVVSKTLVGPLVDMLTVAGEDGMTVGAITEALGGYNARNVIDAARRLYGSSYILNCAHLTFRLA